MKAKLAQKALWNSSTFLWYCLFLVMLKNEIFGLILTTRAFIFRYMQGRLGGDLNYMHI